VPLRPVRADGRETVVRDIGGRWATQQITTEGDLLILGVELASAGHVIGDLMLRFQSAEHRGGEVGWVLHPDHSGQGYATEAVHALLHLSFDQLGLRREAHLMANEWFKGGWSDEVDFALLEDEWGAQHKAGGPSWCGLQAGE